MKNPIITEWEEKNHEWKIVTRRKYYTMLICTILLLCMIISVAFASVAYAAFPENIKDRVFVLVVEHRLDPQQFQEIKSYIDTFKNG
jgi:hypothetical protein